jgi:hypothetical protein
LIGDLATDKRYEAVFLLLAAAVAVLVGVIATSVGWGLLVFGLFTILLSLGKYQHRRSSDR